MAETKRLMKTRISNETLRLVKERRLLNRKKRRTPAHTKNLCRPKAMKTYTLSDKRKMIVDQCDNIENVLEL